MSRLQKFMRFADTLRSGFRVTVIIVIIITLHSCMQRSSVDLPQLRVSDNHRFLATEDGDPFFWLGDTGWLLLTKLTREEAEKYLEDRKQKGFNVIQIMVLHSLRNAVNVYGDTALAAGKIDSPITTPGNDFTDSDQYDFWDHADFIIDLAGKKGIYMGLVP
ncbi:MAG: DUF4038 domain-containing protein, partial [Bacteroidales bacterium]|nr:DUF4038 domain-containing protein [Bacteroidales bacterium]